MGVSKTIFPSTTLTEYRPFDKKKGTGRISSFSLFKFG